MQPERKRQLGLLVGERARQLHVLRAEDIEYVESHGNYVKLHVGQLQYLSRDSLKRLAPVLDAAGFVRIERSLLVNVHALRALRHLGRGSYALTLRSGVCLRSGARYRDTMRRSLGMPLRSDPP
jgi:two-component system, LytTR family, response regulator